VSGSSNSDAGLDKSRMDALWKTWIQAMQVNDVEALASLVTDDFVAIQRQGKCISGKDGLRKNFLREFELADSEPRLISSETSISDKWAIAILEVETARTPVGALSPIRARTRVVAVCSPQPDRSWKIARIVAVPD